jgi:membrane protein implicated in regulation of membrane protease activity
MEPSTFWWILAGIAVGVELVTGTFYLLMLAIGLAAGALAAHAGLPITWQLVVAAVVGGGAVALWHAKRSSQPPQLPASANPNVNLDIGETVFVERWERNGTAVVKYRGSNWMVVLPEGVSGQQTGPHRVIEVQGNRLIVQAV